MMWFHVTHDVSHMETQAKGCAKFLLSVLERDGDYYFCNLKVSSVKH